MTRTQTPVWEWSTEALDLTDPLNDEIWRDSPRIGAELTRRQPIHLLGVGGQQELDPVGPLPWVPDLLGSSWRADGELLVVGSAVSPFYRPGCGRAACMDREEVASAVDAADFLRRFVARVVQPDGSYYGRLARLLAAHAPQSRVALTDLSRAAFGRRMANGRVKGGDAVAKTAQNSPVFKAYAEAGEPWTWTRLTQTPGRLVVTLGELATCCILELFRRRGFEPTSSTGFGLPRSLRDLSLARQYHAPSERGHRFTIVSVYHPSSWDTTLHAERDSVAALGDAVAAARSR